MDNNNVDSVKNRILRGLAAGVGLGVGGVLGHKLTGLATNNAIATAIGSGLGAGGGLTLGMRLSTPSKASANKVGNKAILGATAPMLAGIAPLIYAQAAVAGRQLPQKPRFPLSLKAFNIMRHGPKIGGMLMPVGAGLAAALASAKIKE